MIFCFLLCNKTPLFLAVEKECIEIVKLLLQKEDIDININEKIIIIHE